MAILKTGKNPQSAASYRPISLTSTLGKIMEKLVATRLAYFVEKQNILNNVQSGFRKDRSTLSENEMLRVTRAYEKCIARGGSHRGVPHHTPKQTIQFYVFGGYS